MTVFLFAVFSEGNRWRILLFITQETAHVSRACDDDKLIQARKDKERHIKEHDYSKHTQNVFLIIMFLLLLLFYTLKQSLKTQICSALAQYIHAINTAIKTH